MAFHPDYDQNGLFYVYHYTTSSEAQVTEFSVSGDPNVADAGSARAVFTVPWDPSGTHFGGQLQFGPNGYLWFTIGDGSDGDDVFMNGQDSTNVYGTILRIDVDSGDPYAGPSDNPFTGVAEVPDEIWAYGFRNPWRFSFDRQTGDLYISENGEHAWEEINYQPADDTGGQNYGWSVAEGNHCYPNDPCDMTGLTPPIHEVPHDEADPDCSGSIIGGYVYRGSALPQLQGHYFYANFCTQTVNSFVVSGGMATDHQDWTSDLGVARPVSFGEDADGELYLVSFSDGAVYKIDAVPVS
jgi:glucose/arabinose dehydrogenase